MWPSGKYSSVKRPGANNQDSSQPMPDVHLEDTPPACWSCWRCRRSRRRWTGSSPSTGRCTTTWAACHRSCPCQTAPRSTCSAWTPPDVTSPRDRGWPEVATWASSSMPPSRQPRSSQSLSDLGLRNPLQVSRQLLLRLSLLFTSDGGKWTSTREILGSNENWCPTLNLRSVIINSARFVEGRKKRSWSTGKQNTRVYLLEQFLALLSCPAWRKLEAPVWVSASNAPDTYSRWMQLQLFCLFIREPWGLNLTAKPFQRSGSIMFSLRPVLGSNAGIDKILQFFLSSLFQQINKRWRFLEKKTLA